MTQAPLSGRDLLAALCVVAIWGLNFVAMKLALRDFTPMQLGAARYLFAALPLVFLVRRPTMPWKWLLAYGFAQGVGQFGLLFLALQAGMTAALASVLMQMQVFFTALFGYVLLHERLTRPLAGGLTFAGLGLLCFILNFAVAGQGAVTLAGFVLNLLAAAMWGASNIVARRLEHASPGYDALQFVVWSGLVPIVPFLLLSLVIDDTVAWEGWGRASFKAWAGAAYLGWFATILAYSLWTGLLKRHPANRVAPFSLGVPVVGLAAGMLILNETFSLWQGVGIGCIAVALLCVVLGARGRHMQPPAQRHCERPH
ncbi:MAG TPA: EamA family transporter [Noviherbaspirillum sp.]|nr:EamA family transporter [Noviherbaspirillum sp.]